MHKFVIHLLQSSTCTCYNICNNMLQICASSLSLAKVTLRCTISESSKDVPQSVFRTVRTESCLTNAEGFHAVLLVCSPPYPTVVTVYMFRQVQLCFVLKRCPTHKTLLVKTHHAVGYRITARWRPPELQQGSELVRNDLVNVGEGGQFLRYLFWYCNMPDLSVASDMAHPVFIQ